MVHQINEWSEAKKIITEARSVDFGELLETYINGNISDFVNTVKGLSKKSLVGFIKHVKSYHEDELPAVLTLIYKNI